MNQQTSTDKKALRQFGIIFATGLTVLFDGLFPWLGEYTPPLWPLLTGLIFVTVAFTMPVALMPVHWVWMKIGAVLGWINTRIILSIIFYLIIFPAGLLMRLLRGDPMARNFDPKATSYRVVSHNKPPENMEKPF